MTDLQLTTTIVYANMETNEAKVSLLLNGNTILTVKEPVFSFDDIQNLQDDMVSILSKKLYILLNETDNK